MPTHQTILICFDGSEPSRSAVRQAGAFFPGREALILTVWQLVGNEAVSVTAMAGFAMTGDAMRELSEIFEQQASETAAAGVELAVQAGLTAQPLVASAFGQSLWRVIYDTAEARDVAVIVMGARGLSAIKSAVLGSVSHAVVQHTERPVLVVR
jgi:nucleotide-binding universal stress UspA family protein